MTNYIRVKRVNLLFLLTILWLTGSAQDLQTVTQNGNSTSLGIHTGAASSIFGINFSLADPYTKKLVPTGFNFWLSNGAEDGKLIMPYSSAENARFHNLGLSVDKNIGIGTTSPLTGLQLGNIGPEIAPKQISIPGVYNFETVKLGQIGNGNSALEFVNHSGQNTSYGMRLTTNIDNGGLGLQFQYAGSQNNYELLNYQTGMFLGLTGNVGIGTTNPNEKLSVNGKIRAKEIKVEASNWPDYVFEKDYKVGTLEALESYIKANKHLPEMPSAKEIESNGLVLGEVVKLQQKKIEELTLHLIEKDKELRIIAAKQKEMEALLKKLAENK